MHNGTNSIVCPGPEPMLIEKFDCMSWLPTKVQENRAAAAGSREEVTALVVGGVGVVAGLGRTAGVVVCWDGRGLEDSDCKVRLRISII